MSRRHNFYNYASFVYLKNVDDFADVESKKNTTSKNQIAKNKKINCGCFTCQKIKKTLFCF